MLSVLFALTVVDVLCEEKVHGQEPIRTRPVDTRMYRCDLASTLLSSLTQCSNVVNDEQHFFVSRAIAAICVYVGTDIKYYG